MLTFKHFLEESLRDSDQNPCWKGYKPVGTKQKNGKTVPNCVPEVSESGAGEQGTTKLTNKYKKDTPGQ